MSLMRIAAMHCGIACESCTNYFGISVIYVAHQCQPYDIVVGTWQIAQTQYCMLTVNDFNLLTFRCTHQQDLVCL